MFQSHEEQVKAARIYWNNAATTFDAEADHGLRDPKVYRAWQNLLVPHLPSAPAHVLDIGCGTGSISILMARLGYRVTGVDLAPEMIAQAVKKAKAAGQTITFDVMDAAYPHFKERAFDVIISRHLLWTLPERKAVLRRWTDLLNARGLLLLIEGYWNNAGGLHSAELVDALGASSSNHVKVLTVEELSSQEQLWGKKVSDERYMVVAQLV